MTTRTIADVATALDVTFPGWENKVNLKTLNMHSSNDCLLGQVTGYYSSDESIDFRVAFGDRNGTVFVPIDGYNIDAFCSNDTVPEWTIEINKRRENVKVTTLTVEQLREARDNGKSLDDLIEELDPPKTVTIVLSEKDIEYFLDREWTKDIPSNSNAHYRRFGKALRDAQAAS